MKRVLLSLLLLPACAASGTRSGSSEKPAADSAKTSDAKLPDFSLETIDGGTFTLSEHVGRDVIVMSFWATWCNPCMAELPHLDALYQEEKESGLVIVAVSMDEPTTQAEVAPTAHRLGLTMPVALDTDQQALSLYNPKRAAPMTVVIDRKGQIVRASAGYQPGDEVALAEEVRALLKQ